MLGCIPANSHALDVSLTPAGWKLQFHTYSRLRASFSRLINCCRLAWHNFQKYVNSDPCKEQKPCVKCINDNTFLTISDFWSEKHWEWVCVYTGTGTSDVFGRLWDSLENLRLHRESSEMTDLPTLTVWLWESRFGMPTHGLTVLPLNLTVNQ